MPASRPRKPSSAGSKSKNLDFDRFAWAVAAPDGRSIICKTRGSGRVYELPTTCLRDEMGRPVKRIREARLTDYGYAAVAVLENGREVDFPLDYVLHHCEPAYQGYKMKPSLSPNVGAIVRSLREAKKLTQVELAKLAGISQPGLARVESDAHVPSFDTLVEIARGLGVPWLTLILGGTKMSKLWLAPGPSEEEKKIGENWVRNLSTPAVCGIATKTAPNSITFLVASDGWGCPVSPEPAGLTRRAFETAQKTGTIVFLDGPSSVWHVTSVRVMQHHLVVHLQS